MWLCGPLAHAEFRQRSNLIRFFQKNGLADTIALGVPHTDFTQFFQDQYVFDILGHDLDAHHANHPRDRFGHRQADLFVEDVLHKLAIDFHIVYWQALEIGKRAHADAEIIQGEPETVQTQPPTEIAGVLDVRNRCRFGYLEADGFRHDIKAC